MANSLSAAAPVAPGAIIENFRIVEFVGAGAQFNFYLAARANVHMWLVQNFGADKPFALPGGTETVQANGQTWYAVPISRMPVSEIAQVLARAELRFWGWRWVSLARSMSFVHQRGALWQTGNVFGLNYLFFNNAGELLYSQGNDSTAPEYAFLPPEGNRSATPASDVYSLAAALRAVLGTALTPQVMQVLNRATDANPAQRYPDAKSFADALAAALPSKKAAVEKAPKRTPRWIFLAAGALMLLACLGAAAIFIPPQLEQASAPAPTAEPTAAIARLTTDVRGWKMDAQCNALLNMHVQVGDQAPDENAQLRFVMSQGDRRIEAVRQVSSSDRTDHTLNFNLGDFCARGGEVKVQTQIIGQQVVNVLYYYPDISGAGEFAGIRLGTSQVITKRYPSMRMYFGFTDVNGKVARLGGALRLRILQDGENVKKFTFSSVDASLDPLTVALVLDTSGSMKGEALLRAQEAAIQFVNGLNKIDRVCVYRFSTQVELLQECTLDHAAAIQALNSLTADGKTALYDALVKVSAGQTGQTERQAIVVLSDGADTASASKLEDALDKTTRTNVPIYTIGLLNQDLQPGILKQIAERNGGVYLEAPMPAELAGLYAKINEGLANQYQLDFESLFPERKQGTLQITISNDDSEFTFSRDFIVD